MSAVINSLSVKLDDDHILEAIADAVFGAGSSLGLDPAIYELYAVLLEEDGTTGERHLNVEVRPK